MRTRLDLLRIGFVRIGCGGIVRRLGRAWEGLGIKLNTQDMKSRGRTMPAIKGLNVVLAGVLLAGIVGFAGAQAVNDRRVGGRYTCVGGKTLGGYTNVIYVLDSANREMVALRWNDGLKQLEGIGYRDLVTDITKENDR